VRILSGTPGTKLKVFRNNLKILSTLIAIALGGADFDRRPDRLQSKIQESHSGLWDVGIAEIPRIPQILPESRSTEI